MSASSIVRELLHGAKYRVDVYYLANLLNQLVTGKSTAESDITALQGDVTTLQGDVADLTPEAWHVVGGMGEPAFENSWVSDDTGLYFLSFRKVGDTVQLRGSCNGGTASAVIFTLPASHRPAKDVCMAMTYFDGADSKPGQVVVAVDGTVYSDDPSVGNTALYFDGVSFSL